MLNSRRLTSFRISSVQHGSNSRMHRGYYNRDLTSIPFRIWKIDTVFHFWNEKMTVPVPFQQRILGKER
jgi:hypothetical protein